MASREHKHTVYHYQHLATSTPSFWTHFEWLDVFTVEQRKEEKEEEGKKPTTTTAKKALTKILFATRKKTDTKMFQLRTRVNLRKLYVYGVFSFFFTLSRSRFSTIAKWWANEPNEQKKKELVGRRILLWNEEAEISSWKFRKKHFKAEWTKRVERNNGESEREGVSERIKEKSCADSCQKIRTLFLFLLLLQF